VWWMTSVYIERLGLSVTYEAECTRVYTGTGDGSRLRSLRITGMWTDCGHGTGIWFDLSSSR
jgi:hypothetical protein